MHLRRLQYTGRLDYKMSFVSFAFLAFIAAACTLYFTVPIRYRWIVLLTASYIYFGLNSKWMLLAMLILSAGIWMGSSHNPAGGMTLIATDSQSMREYAMLYLTLLGLGILFTWLATSMAVRKYIRMKLDKLYF